MIAPGTAPTTKKGSPASPPRTTPAAAPMPVLTSMVSPGGRATGVVSIWLDPGVLTGAAEAAVAPKSAMSVAARMAAMVLKGSPLLFGVQSVTVSRVRCGFLSVV